MKERLEKLYVSVSKEIKETAFAHVSYSELLIPNLSKFSATELKEKLSNKAGKHFIYIISTEHFPYQREEIVKKFDKLEVNTCKINDENNEDKWKASKNGKTCLYVGKSDDLEKRLKEHLGLLKAKTTYAMHLNEWWKDADIKITILEYNLDIKYVKLLEYSIWNDLKPLFGKQA
ncbi:hypothetical protein RsTz2092_10560 [Deferribacterales bacterium RsTz2092]|nr:hypothetical protein AGMMS49941_11870 [Deferribacterales bacterium]